MDYAWIRGNTDFENEDTGEDFKTEIGIDEEFDDILILKDEDGYDIPFQFLTLVEYDNEAYVVLMPVEDAESGEVVILRVEEEGGDSESYVSVGDTETLDAVFGIFKEKYKHIFHFSES